MSHYTEYRISQFTTFAAILAAIICLGRMSPWASPYHNKAVFAVLIVAIIIGLCAATGYYYYRAKLRGPDTGAVAVKTLAATGEQPHTPDKTPHHPPTVLPFSAR